MVIFNKRSAAIGFRLSKPLAKCVVFIARHSILTHYKQIEDLQTQLSVQATEQAEPREQICRSSHNSTKPASGDGLGFKLPESRKGNSHKLSGQLCHAGTWPGLLRYLDLGSQGLNDEIRPGRPRGL